MRHRTSLTLIILAGCSGRDVPIATHDPDAASVADASSIGPDGSMATPEDEMKQFQQTAIAIANTAAATPLTCTYENALTGEIVSVAFGVDVGPVGGEPCLGYADCPYDFSWLFVDVHPSGPPKTFSMVAMYRPGRDSLVANAATTSGITTTQFAYRFAGFYTDALTFVRHDSAASHSVDVLYVKTDDSGGLVMRVTCAPVAISSGL
jgi:hypothetical protein